LLDLIITHKYWEPSVDRIVTAQVDK